jgi:lipopolysaccharide transport system ATP-binding protein
MAVTIKVENLSKAYQLGQFSTGTLSKDIHRWWQLARGKEDPFLKIGETNDRSQKGESNIVWSLKDINFEIEQGDAVGIIGKNGAGKSTLLKILSQVTTPTAGKVKVKGRIASLLEVGTGFHPELTGRENIFLNGAILGMRRKEIAKKFDEIVDFSGVERYIDTPVKRYSSGMYVRLAFAVAAHLESEILIVDEVLAVGDSDFQKKCLGKMGEVSKGEGRTVLFVSHNISSIKALCDSAILLENGMLKTEGETDVVIDKYIYSSSDNFDREIDLDVWDNPYLILQSITVNSSTNRSIALENHKESLTFKMDLVSKEKLKFSPFFYIKSDKQDTVAICSPGHESSANLFDIDGKMSLTVEIDFRKFVAGRYLLSFGLAYPGVQAYCYQEDWIEIEMAGTPLENGLLFSQKSGFFQLSAKCLPN